MIDELKRAGIDLGLALAGFAGSVLMSSKESGKNLGRTIASLLGGAASANYVTPLILKLARLDGEPQYAYAAAFLLGFCGLRAVETISSKLITDEPRHDSKRTR
jgi:hypothetical protein